MTSKLLMEWYMKGFNDELKGTSTIMDCSKYLECAYSIGAGDGLVGDEISHLDYQTEEEIIKRIFENYKNLKR